MSQRESKQLRKREPTKEKRTLTKQQPDNSTIITADAGGVQEQMRGGDDQILKDVANILKGKWIKLNYQEWYSVLQIVHNRSVYRVTEDLTQRLTDIISGSESNAASWLQRGSFPVLWPWCCCLCNMIIVMVFLLLALLVTLNVDNMKIGKFDINNFFMLNPESAQQWEQLDKNSVRILVTGKTGTGKSALINGLIGDDVAQEGDTLDPTTSEVQEIKQMVHGISLSIFDSPGLQDGTERENEYLQDMEQKCEKVDLVLYTIKMTDQRVNVEDTDAMAKLTEAFGYNFWKKAMFVMTFANEIRSPEYPEDKHENRKYFEERLQLWKDGLPVFVEQRSRIPISIGKDVPIVPAGYYKTRDLPGRKFWFSQFWKAALDRMMESSAEGAGYMLQFSQDRLKHFNDTTEEDFEKPIHEQPILSKIVDE